MKDLFEAIVTFLIVGAFAVAGIVLTAFGSVIAGAFYLVGIIAGGDSGGYLGHRPDDCGFVFAEKKS